MTDIKYHLFTSTDSEFAYADKTAPNGGQIPSVGATVNLVADPGDANPSPIAVVTRVSTSASGVVDVTLTTDVADREVVRFATLQSGWTKHRSTS